MTKDVMQGVIAPLPAQYRQADYELTDVTPAEVRSILRYARGGRMIEQDRLFRLMEDTWAMLRKIKIEVIGAIAKLEIEICPGKKEDEDEPSEQAKAIHETIERAFESTAPRPGYWEYDTAGMIRSLVDAYFKGQSVVEILWHIENGIVSPRCYCQVPARYYGYPQSSQEVERLMMVENPKSYGAGTLTDFPANKFLIATWQNGSGHPIHASNLRPLTKHWLASVYGHGWFMQYAQLFGVPWLHAETDGTDDAMSKAKDMMDTIGSEGKIITGPGNKINVLDGVKGDASGLPQAVLMDKADDAACILLLGQKLTTDTGANGNRSLGEVHASIRMDRLRDVADWIADILTNQLIPAIVRLNYGELPAEDMPYAKIIIPEPKDDKAIAERFKLYSEIGIPMPEEWAYEQLGIPIPQDGDKIFMDKPDVPEVAPVPVIPDGEDPEDEPLIPTEDMAATAQTALDRQRALPALSRLFSGIGTVETVRARNIATRTHLTREQVDRMKQFFDAHETVRASDKWDHDSKLAAQWNSCGGDAGYQWIKSL